MGKKQQDALKAKQVLINYEIYYIPEAHEIIKQIVQAVHSKDYVRIVKRGRKTCKITYKAMEKPELMIPKYLYIIHYLIRRKLQFKFEYTTEGFGISVVDLRKRICVDDSMMSLMMEVLQTPPFQLIERVKKHSTYNKKARKYILVEYIEELIDKEKKLILNRRDHGKMVEMLIKYGEEGKSYNKVEKAVKEQAVVQEQQDLPSDKTEGGADESIQSVQQIDAFNVKKNTGAITHDIAILYFKELRKKKINSNITQPEDLERAILKRMAENKALAEDKKQQLLTLLPEYIKTIPIPVMSENDYTPLLEPIYQRLHTIYRNKNMLAHMMHSRIMEASKQKADYTDVWNKVEAFVESKINNNK